jgi:two-component system CheB/CheR fusion protein
LLQDKTPEIERIDHEFEALLEYLKRNRGFDFTGYKRSGLMRRVIKRMQMLDIKDSIAYIDYLEVHPDEFAHLFNMILINVTAFFRDAAAWEYLQQEVVPRIVASKRREDPIRLWSAGCASGEEAYTLAMIMAGTLGLDEFRERVKIYATDVDEDALNRARQASYSAREVAGVPEALQEKYFERQGPQYIFHKDLRRAVIFGRHDLIQDAPISRIDLLVCRNALMYFNAEVQAKILTRLNFALSDNGYLFLGKAEMLFTHASLFLPLDLKRRIFAKVARGPLRDRTLMMGQADGNTENSRDLDTRVREIVFEYGPVAQVTIDVSGRLAQANERARSLFRLAQRDLGRPLQDLEISYRPVELRSCIEQAYAERRLVVVKEVAWPPSVIETRYLDVQVQPLYDTGGKLLGASVCFFDVTRFKQLQEELQESNRELETAYEELQSTNEELETTNEELQSTVEELETTNEELQSTNEELETMNEELQFTNEELQTINDELRQRSLDLNQVNAFMQSILSSMREGIVVVDQELQVQVWNHRAEDLWGLRFEEVQGKHFLNLDIGLPTEQLRSPIRQCLAKERDRFSITLDALNRRGKSIRCRVTCGPLVEAGGHVRGAILSAEEEPPN